MTTAPDQATLLNSVLENILYVADAVAVRHIQAYGDRNGMAELEDIAGPYEPSLQPLQARQTAPSLDARIKDAVSNRANWSPFAVKIPDIMDTVTMDASKQAREELPATEWAALVQAAATQILQVAGASHHQEAIVQQIANLAEG